MQCFGSVHVECFLDEPASAAGVNHCGQTVHIINTTMQHSNETRSHSRASNSQARQTDTHFDGWPCFFCFDLAAQGKAAAQPATS